MHLHVKLASGRLFVRGEAADAADKVDAGLVRGRKGSANNGEADAAIASDIRGVVGEVGEGEDGAALGVGG
jgi:hypothetical protein